MNAMILMPQIFEVTANENAGYKRNELEFAIPLPVLLEMLEIIHYVYLDCTSCVLVSPREQWWCSGFKDTNLLEFYGLNRGLANVISKLRYLLLPSPDMTVIRLKLRKILLQPNPI